MKIRNRPRFPEPGGGAWKDSSASTRSTSMSRASVKRDLEYMRSRFNAPIEYDRELNGYRFGKPRSGRLRSVTESGCRGALRARGSLDEIVENVALHALDPHPVAGAELGPFLRPCALAEVLEQAFELRYALPRDGKFLIVADHATSNLPRALRREPLPPSAGVVARRLTL